MRRNSASPCLRAAVLVLLVAAGSLRGQTVSEYPISTPNSQPLRITVGPDGNLWFAESEVNKVGRITPAGVITEFPTTAPMPDSPNATCTGPDGNIWFTMLHGNVGRMTTAGAATLFAKPSPASQLAGCVAGPDGNIWFTDPGVGKVGKVTMAGVSTEYTPSGPVGLPNSITAGPDGALWFTDSTRSRIGRVTTAGAFTFFPTLTAGAFPQDIVVGADGNVWFTETTIQAPYVGRITPAGVVSEFLTPDLRAPSWIAAGPDGNIWYTQPNNSQGHVGRVSIDGGSILVFPTLTANAAPAGIVAGPDGALWFAEFNAGKIGRMTTSAMFHPLTPCRVADTRGPDGAYGGPALDPSDVFRTFVLAGRCGIPAGATAVSFNFTVTQPTDAGVLVIYPSQSVVPDVSTLSYHAGQTRANNAVLGLGADRDIDVHVDQPPGGFVHFIIDVNGYFQ